MDRECRRYVSRPAPLVQVVHGRPELVLGGCGIIPTQNASTPTLTASAFAVAAVEEMLKTV